ncbi:MAG: protein-tyrosine-phosphatase, partial [Planctomycetota bacterium]
VAALSRAGLDVEQTTPEPNPIYHVRYSDSSAALTCFSKVYDVAPNPGEGFAAIMVCGHADENCPLVHGVEMRTAIRYDDPKVSDGTPAESATYDERCAQIAREMLYAFSLVGE